MIGGAFGYTADIAQVVLGLVFLSSAGMKLRSPRRFVDAVAEYRILPGRLAVLFGALLMPFEVVLGLSLVSGLFAEIALPLSGLLLVLFLLAASITLRRGTSVPCGCFGNPEEVVSRSTIMRQALLLIVAAWALAGHNLAGGQPPLVSDLRPDLLVLTLLPAILVLILGVWLTRSRDLYSLAKGPMRKRPVRS